MAGEREGTGTRDDAGRGTTRRRALLTGGGLLGLLAAGGAGYATGQAMFEILSKACQSGDLTREGVFNAKQSNEGLGMITN